METKKFYIGTTEENKKINSVYITLNNTKFYSTTNNEGFFLEELIFKIIFEEEKEKIRPLQCFVETEQFYYILMFNDPNKRSSVILENTDFNKNSLNIFEKTTKDTYYIQMNDHFIWITTKDGNVYERELSNYIHQLTNTSSGVNMLFNVVKKNKIKVIFSIFIIIINFYLQDFYNQKLLKEETINKDLIQKNTILENNIKKTEQQHIIINKNNQDKIDKEGLLIKKPKLLKDYIDNLYKDEK